MGIIIGRKREQEELEEAYHSGRPEFIAVYGRRRVGKTYLVRELFKDRLVFSHTGLPPTATHNGTPVNAQQLQNFAISLHRHGDETADTVLTNWFIAFEQLGRLLDRKRNGQRQVVFIDELPWMDTPRSDFFLAFGNFWNSYGSWHDDVMLIVCGSATSWMTDKLIHDYGGLYDRLTRTIRLSPFCLHETEQYLTSHNIIFNRYDELQCQMMTGGIPYYLDLFRKGLSLPQNIDELFFRKNATLADEFNSLFNSIFINPKHYISVVKALATSHQGLTKKELLEKTSLSDGGTFSKILNVLKENELVFEYTPFQARKSETRYKLIDHFCLFYLKYQKYINTESEHFWQTHDNTPAVNAWRGLAFEDICFNHLAHIKEALKIGAVQTSVSSWIGHTEDSGAQIDMIIERADKVINLCEMKCTLSPFVITKDYDARLCNKLDVFRQQFNPKQALHLTLITTYAPQKNEYSSRFQSVITLDDLFRPLD